MYSADSGAASSAAGLWTTGAGKLATEGRSTPERERSGELIRKEGAKGRKSGGVGSISLPDLQHFVHNGLVSVQSVRGATWHDVGTLPCIRGSSSKTARALSWRPTSHDSRPLYDHRRTRQLTATPRGLTITAWRWGQIQADSLQLWTHPGPNWLNSGQIWSPAVGVSWDDFGQQGPTSTDI